MSARLVLCSKIGAVHEMVELLEGDEQRADANFHFLDGSLAGSTALIEASRGHHWHAMSVLLEHGADPNLSAIDPTEGHSLSARPMLLLNGLPTPLCAALEAGKGDAMCACVQLLLNYGANPDTTAMMKVTWMSVGGFYKGGKQVTPREYLRHGGVPGPLGNHEKGAEGEMIPNSCQLATMKLLKKWESPEQGRSAGESQDHKSRLVLIQEWSQAQAQAGWWQIVRCGKLVVSGRAVVRGRIGRVLAGIYQLPFHLQEFVISYVWGLQTCAWPRAVPRSSADEPAYFEEMRPPTALRMMPVSLSEPAVSAVVGTLCGVLPHCRRRATNEVMCKPRLVPLPAIGVA